MAAVQGLAGSRLAPKGEEGVGLGSLASVACEEVG